MTLSPKIRPTRVLQDLERRNRQVHEQRLAGAVENGDAAALRAQAQRLRECASQLRRELASLKVVRALLVLMENSSLMWIPSDSFHLTLAGARQGDLKSR